MNGAYKLEEPYLEICDDNNLYLMLLMQTKPRKEGDPTASVLLMRTNSGPGLRALARTGKMANPAVMRQLKVFMMSSTLWIKQFC